MDLIPLLIVLTVGLATPGPDFILVLRGGLAGWRQGQATVLGISLGLTVQVGALLAGFSWLAAKPEALRFFQYAGAAVLVWLGIRLIRAGIRARADTEPDSRPLPFAAAFRDGLLCNLTNAKAFLFFTALFSAAQASPHSLTRPAPLAGLIVLHGLLCWSLLNLLLQARVVRRLLLRIQPALLTLFGSLLILFALLAALPR